ncbi:potassium transporter KefB [Pontibacter sp. KCTC 32443]|uniref:potassium transporter KefB n=1 Tax=Pontibacter TaxID=323449 RepID=UPI00164D3989|nr:MULTISPECIES: potassium transporter KefB [Pontibacter]MBC5772886.1 potassium transporter KefB [Pontibacter sp. KCTC 32443]
MTQRSGFQNHPVHGASVGKRMLHGAVIGLIIISFFLIGAGDPDPSWSRFWMVKPLLIVPAAGALGGLFYYNMDYLRYEGGWRKALAYVLSLVVFIVVLWLGIVLGLNGTMWD